MGNDTTPASQGTVCSGTSCDVTLTPAPKELDISDFVFRNPIDPLPQGKEKNRSEQYCKKPKWGKEILDRRLREKVVVTFNAVKTDKKTKYKIYLVKKVDNGKFDHLEVVYDDKNKEEKFSFFAKDQFFELTEGKHYWELWTLKYKDPQNRKLAPYQKLDLIPEGTYKCRITTLKENIEKEWESEKENIEKEWESENEIEVRYNPFKVVVVCRPMNNGEIEQAKNDDHYIGDHGQRIDKDCVLKVYRGGDPYRTPKDSVLVGTFPALMMPTWLNKIATPRSNLAPGDGAYYGYKDWHYPKKGSRYRCLEIESQKRNDDNDGIVWLPPGIKNNPPKSYYPECSGGNYKDQVQIHKNPNSGWTSVGLSTGCITVPSNNPKDFYGKFGDRFNNRQNNSGAKVPHDNSHSLMAAIFGGYDEKIIPNKKNRNTKLEIKVFLEPSVGVEYSIYRSIHEHIIQDLRIDSQGTGFHISFRVPIGIFRNYRGAEKHFPVKGQTTYRWYIARVDRDRKITPLIWNKDTPEKFSELEAREHTWSWDGYDKPPANSDRKREFGTCLCVIETKFDNGLNGTDKIKENCVLAEDTTIGSAWHVYIQSEAVDYMIA